MFPDTNTNWQAFFEVQKLILKNAGKVYAPCLQPVGADRVSCPACMRHRVPGIGCACTGVACGRGHARRHCMWSAAAWNDELAVGSVKDMHLGASGGRALKCCTAHRCTLPRICMRVLCSC